MTFNHATFGGLILSVLLASPSTVLADNPGASKSVPDSAQVEGSAAGGTTVGKLAPADKAFVIKATEAGLAEHQLGSLAAERATSEEVKHLAGHLADAHAVMNRQLAGVVATDDVQPPNDLSADDQATYDRLKNIDKAGFDKAYLDEEMKAHKTAVALFTKEAASGANIDVAAWAKKELPELRAHEKMIGKASAKSS